MADIQDDFPGRPPRQPPNGSDDVMRRLTTLETVIATILPTLATKADVAEVKTDLIKVLLTGLALSVGILIFAINRVSPPQPLPTNAQPIVIYSQQPGQESSPAAKPHGESTHPRRPQPD